MLNSLNDIFTESSPNQVSISFKKSDATHQSIADPNMYFATYDGPDGQIYVRMIRGIDRDVS